MDRKLIKKQARTLIRGNVWKLFVISLVTVMLVPLVQGVVTLRTTAADLREIVEDGLLEEDGGFNSYGSEEEFDFYNFGNDDAFDPYYFDDFGSRIGALPTAAADEYGSGDFGDFGDFGTDDYGYADDYGYYDGYGDFGEYDGDGWGLYPGDDYNSNDAFENRYSVTPQSMLRFLVTLLLSFVLSVAAIILLPVQTTAAGYYVQTVRGRKPDVGKDIGYIYKTAFKTAYFKKLGLELLMNLAIGAASLLFIVPGVILSLHWAFARQILCDNPEMDIFDALRLSGQMTKGHKGELFVLWLSFLGWFLLGSITLGLAWIYVYPYYQTTVALYYQNFKIRALQTHAVDPQEFMSQAERAAQFTAQTGTPWGAGANGYVPHQEQAQPNTGCAPPQTSAYPCAQASPAQSAGGVTFTEAQYTVPQEPDYIRPEAPKDVFAAAEEPQDVFEAAQEAAEPFSAPQATESVPNAENAGSESQSTAKSGAEAAEANSVPQPASDSSGAENSVQTPQSENPEGKGAPGAAGAENATPQDKNGETKE